MTRTAEPGWIEKNIINTLRSKNPEETVKNLRLQKIIALVAVIAIGVFFGLFCGLLAGVLARDFLEITNKIGDVLNKKKEALEKVDLKKFSLTEETKNYLFQETWVVKHLFEVIR